MAVTKVIAQTSKPASKLAKEMKIEGKTNFKINAHDFVISPLQAQADLHILSNHYGVENDMVIATINADEYTQISGLVPNLTMYLDTEETFYIKF